MDATDKAAALIARNRALLAQAMEARQRAREVVARAEGRVQQAMHAQLAAEQVVQGRVTPRFDLHPRRERGPSGDAA